MNQKSVKNFLWSAGLVAVFAVDAAMASAGITAITQEGHFTKILSLGFAVGAVYSWIQYFANFKPESALTNIFVPAILTYLAFQWQTVLSWFNLG